MTDLDMAKLRLALGDVLATAAAAAAAAGWRPKQYRIERRGDGHSLQRHTLHADGAVRWVEVLWSRNLAWIRAALLRREGGA